MENEITQEQRSWKRNLAILWCGIFLVCASYTMVVPFLPIFLLKDLQLPPNEAKIWTGAIIAVTFVIASFMAPFWGARGDIIGQKQNVLRAGVGLTICYGLIAFSETPMHLFIARALTGVISGFVPACMTIGSSTLPKDKMGWGMGMLQTANASGSIMGPLLGGLLSAWFSMRTSFFVAAFALFMATVAIYGFVYENRVAEQAQTKRSAGLLSIFKDLSHALHNKVLLYIMAIFVLLQSCLMLVQPLLALYVNELMHGAPEAVQVAGFVLSLAGIAGIIAAPFWGRRGQKFGYAKILALVMICAGVTNTLQLFTHGVWSFACVYFVFGLFLAGTQPNLMSYMVDSIPEEERGKGFGLTNSAMQLGGAIGPLLGGFLGTLMSMGELLALAGVGLICTGIHVYKTHTN